MRGSTALFSDIFLAMGQNSQFIDQTSDQTISRCWLLEMSYLWQQASYPHSQIMGQKCHWTIPRCCLGSTVLFTNVSDRGSIAWSDHQVPDEMSLSSHLQMFVLNMIKVLQELEEWCKTTGSRMLTWQTEQICYSFPFYYFPFFLPSLLPSFPSTLHPSIPCRSGQIGVTVKHRKSYSFPWSLSLNSETLVILIPKQSSSCAKSDPALHVSVL